VENERREKEDGEKKRNRPCSSLAAEYLTFIAAGGGSETSVEMRYEDENFWLTQKSVIRNFRITAADGKNYTTKHYNLSAVIAVG
jgi:hypothetical protein